MREHFVRLMKYVVVGGSAAIINWLVFFCLFKIAGINYLVCGFCSFVVATFWNLVWAKKMIFKDSRHKVLTEGFLIYLASAVGLLIDLGFLYLLVHFLNIDEMLSKIISTGIAFFFNFGIRNFVIYRN